MERLVEAHAEGEQHADRDRHVHVGPAVAQRAPGRGKEDAAGIDQRREGDQRRDPVEHVAGRGVRAGPDRHRQQHDVAGGEARDRKRADKSLSVSSVSSAPHREGMRRSRWSLSVSMNGAGGLSACQRIATRLVERLTRAFSTPGSAPSAASTFWMQPPQWMPGTERSVWRTPSPMMRLASSNSSFAVWGSAIARASSAPGAQQLIGTPFLHVAGIPPAACRYIAASSAIAR